MIFATPTSHDLLIRKIPHLSAGVVRLMMKDQRGIIARVADVIARHDINIDSLEQEPRMPRGRVAFVITVEPASELTNRAAVDVINALEFMVEPVLLLPIG